MWWERIKAKYLFPGVSEILLKEVDEIWGTEFAKGYE